jgi:hypothetical protein
VYEVWTVTVEIGGTDLESPVAATKHKSRPRAWSRQLPGSNPGSAWIGQGPGPGRRGKEAGVRASDATPPWRVLVLSCPGAAQAALASIQLHLPPTFQTDLARPAKSPNLISSLRNTSPPAPPAVPRRHSFRYCNNPRVQPPCRFRRHTNHCHRNISCLQRHIKRRRAKMPSLVLVSVSAEYTVWSADDSTRIIEIHADQPGCNTRESSPKGTRPGTFRFHAATPA